MPRIYTRIPIEKRFWNKVRRGKSANDCWSWVGANNGVGYGKIGSHIYGVNLYAHRLSWVIHFGPIPLDMFVLHHCDNPQCTNPKHLFLGDNFDNSDDKLAKGRHKFGHHVGETHPRAILTEDQVKDIRSKPKSFGLIANLARQYGVTEGAIHNVRNRKTWKHLP